MKIIKDNYIPYTFTVTGRIVSFDRFLFDCLIDKDPKYGYENRRVCIWLDTIWATVDSTNCTATEVCMNANDFEGLMRECGINPDVLLRKHIDKISHIPHMRKEKRDILRGYLQMKGSKIRCWNEARPDPMEFLLMKAKAEEYYSQAQLSKKA